MGGGIVGVSIAYHLARRGAGRVVILEREPELGTGSTSKATGGIRHQFSTEVNIRLSQMSSPHFIDFAEETGTDIGWRQHGYLFLALPGPKWDALQQSAALQVRLGVPTRLVTPKEARALVPQLHVDDLAEGYVRVAESGLAAEIFNLTDRSRSTVGEMAAAAARAAGCARTPSTKRGRSVPAAAQPPT